MTTTAGVTYSYDGDGKRVKKSSGTLYWTGMGSDALDETDLAGTVQREYVYFNGKRVARLTPPSTVRYFYSDHLGSHGLVTSATGAIQEESDYHPYGEEAVIVDTLSTQPYKFTGKERDAESGLDYFIVRHYSSALGRFMQPDEFKGGPVDAFDGETGPPGPLPYANIFNPQSLNKYSYTYNNPLRYTDPNGHCAEDACLVEGAVAIGAGVIFTAATIQYYRQNPDAGAALAAGASAAHQAFTNAMGAISGLFFSKDAEAGQLQAAGRDATDRANATIERASQDIAGFKNPADVKSHIDELQKGVDRVRDLSGQLDKTKGKTERDKIKSDLQKAIDQVKGHEKDLRNKPPKKPEKQESQ
jgi:RHS repeat-associated protein